MYIGCRKIAAFLLLLHRLQKRKAFIWVHSEFQASEMRAVMAQIDPEWRKEPESDAVLTCWLDISTLTGMEVDHLLEQQFG